MYEDQKHKHSYTVTKEYISEGKNLVGKNVRAVMENVICPGCGEDNIRLKHYE